MLPRRLTLPFLLSAFRFLPGAILHLPSHRFGTCCVCSGKTLFLWFAKGPREMPICARCLSNSRHRHVARTILSLLASRAESASLREARPLLAPYAIYEAQSDGSIHQVLEGLPGYVCSEYFDGIPPGTPGPRGVRCEDLQSLSFRDGTFDLVITQDVLEHVRHPDRAIREITRVLKPGGHHLFTVPIDLGREHTVALVDVSGRKDRFLGPPSYHKDSLRLEGTLAYNDFGRDLLVAIDNTGMRTSIIHSTEEDQRDRQIHGSTVFLSRKLSP